MSNRERWIVYPLLFFAFALGAKAQLFQVTGLETTSVVCRELMIVSPDGQRRIQLVGTDESGILALTDAKGTLRAILRTNRTTGQGQLEFGDYDGSSLVRLEAGPRGGVLHLERTDGQLDVVLGHSSSPDAAGLIALSGGQLVSTNPSPPSTEPRPWGLQIELPGGAQDNTKSNDADASSQQAESNEQGEPDGVSNEAEQGEQSSPTNEATRAGQADEATSSDTGSTQSAESDAGRADEVNAP